MISALLKKSWRDLSRRKARTIFTILTVALGVMGIALFAITPLADQAVERELQDENMHNIGIDVTDVKLTDDQLEELTEIDNIKDVSAKAILPALIDIGKRKERALIIGIRDFEDQKVDKVRIISGDKPEEMKLLTDQGNEANKVITAEKGDIVSIELEEEKHNLEISGVGKNFIIGGATGGGIAVFYTDIKNVWEISGRSGYTYLSFTLDDTESKAMDKSVEDIRDYLVTNSTVVAFNNLPDLREKGFWEGREIFTSLMGFMGILAMLILFVSIFLISNTMNTMVSEQKVEIAMMKAIGATRLRIFRSFLTTSALIGIIGSLLGALLGIFIAYAVLYIFLREGFGIHPTISIHFPTVFISIVIGISVVILASLPALFRTLRVSVIEGLESHGISAKYGASFIDKAMMGIRGFPRIIQMGIRNALRRKGRSITTILQISFAVGVILAMLILGYQIIDVTVGVYDTMTWDLQVNVDENPANPMTIDKANLVKEIDGVKSAEPFIQSNVEINDRIVSADGLIQNTNSYDYSSTLLEQGQGRFWTKEEAANKADVCVIGDALSRYEDVKLGDTIKLMTATGEHGFKVVGIDTNFWNNGQVVYLPLSTFQKVLQKEKGVSGFFLKTNTNDHDEIDEISVRIRDELADKGFRADVNVQYVMAEQNIVQNRMISNMFLAVSFIVVFIVLIGLMSALVMNILDRTMEIGMLRCIGALSKDIRRVFSSEGLFLAVIGWIIGIPVGYGISKIVGLSTENSMKLSLPDVFPIEYVAWSFVFTIIGTLVIIFFPLRRASRLKPGDALRYE